MWAAGRFARVDSSSIFRRCAGCMWIRRISRYFRLLVLTTVADDPVGDLKRMLLAVIVRSIQDLLGSIDVYSYSVRKATTGSTRRALRAGIAIAAKAVNMRMTDTPMNVNGSVDWTPNSI